MQIETIIIIQSLKDTCVDCLIFKSLTLNDFVSPLML